MQLAAHLAFNGTCETAFKFYEKCFGGKIVTMMTYADTPAAGQVPAGWVKKIIHATMMIGDQALMGCDAPPDRYQKPQGIAVMLGVGAPAEADRIFKALAENGQVQMPIEETFWALRFGMVVDQYGTPWMINCGRPGTAK